MTIGMEN